MTSARRAHPCPAAGCTQWAVRADDREIITFERYIWSCSSGHHGPRVIGARLNGRTA